MHKFGKPMFPGLSRRNTAYQYMSVFLAYFSLYNHVASLIDNIELVFLYFIFFVKGSFDFCWRLGVVLRIVRKINRHVPHFDLSPPLILYGFIKQWFGLVWCVSLAFRRLLLRNTFLWWGGGSYNFNHLESFTVWKIISMHKWFLPNLPFEGVIFLWISFHSGLFIDSLITFWTIYISWC